MDLEIKKPKVFYSWNKYLQSNVCYSIFYLQRTESALLKIVVRTRKIWLCKNLFYFRIVLLKYHM